MSHPAPLPSSSPPATPSRRVLVADDDVSTREFLAAALKGLGYTPSLAADGHEAREKATHERFDALLLDCRMPGAGAEDVLNALRATPHAASRTATAFATSAEVLPAQRQRLLDAGFAGVIEKPCRIATLAQVLSAALEAHAPRVSASDPLDSLSQDKVLDDDEALTATGDTNTMQALRGLLREELRELDRQLDRYSAQPHTLIDRLHRLRSACGFCGATRLGLETKTLQGLIGEHGDIADALERFRHALRATTTALDQTKP